jgi:hypothetical protein
MCRSNYWGGNPCEMLICLFCELCASPEYQEKSAKKRKSGELIAPHTFGVDGYVCRGQRGVNPQLYFFFITIYAMIWY